MLIRPNAPKIIKPEDIGNMCEAELMHYMERQGFNWKAMLTKLVKSTAPYLEVGNQIVMLKEKARDREMLRETFMKQGKMVVMIHGM